jgi:(p)ppGpp synthase/HD superfamily hydrolase
MEEIVQKALGFATKAHGEQKRKYTGEPYINHPVAVMNILKDLGFHESVLCAALLHDVVEDTPVKIQEIEEAFGPVITRMVLDLTDVYTAESFPNIRRKERKMLECYRILKIGGNAKSIKLADLIDNSISILEHDPGFAKVYIKEKEELLFVLDGGDQRLMQMAVKSMLEAKKKLTELTIN